MNSLTRARVEWCAPGLETKGTLMEALFEAQQRTIGEMEALA